MGLPTDLAVEVVILLVLIGIAARLDPTALR
jgi:hypothetical protein